MSSHDQKSVESGVVEVLELAREQMTQKQGSDRVKAWPVEEYACAKCGLRMNGLAGGGHPATCPRCMGIDMTLTDRIEADLVESVVNRKLMFAAVDGTTYEDPMEAGTRSKELLGDADYAYRCPVCKKVYLERQKCCVSDVDLQYCRIPAVESSVPQAPLPPEFANELVNTL